MIRIETKERSIFSFNNEELENIPVVISFALPCYKRPKLDQQFYTGSGQIIKNFVVHEISSFVYDWFISNYVKKIDAEVVRVLYEEKFFSQYCMMNKPWRADAFIKGKWYEVTPTFEEVATVVNEIFQQNKTQRNSTNSDQVSNSDFMFEDVYKF